MELSFVRTLLRSVTAVPKAVEAESWDLKLDRNSSPAIQGGGAPPPIMGDEAALSGRRVETTNWGLAAVRGGRVAFRGRAHLGSGKSTDGGGPSGDE